jgi:hypothetical protein
MWHQQAGAVQIRATMSIPVRNAEGLTVAVISLFGAYPNQFESASMLQFAQGLQHRWELILAACTKPAAAIRQNLAVALRERLFAGGLTMYLQPLVDLNSGQGAESGSTGPADQGRRPGGQPRRLPAAAGRCRPRSPVPAGAGQGTEPAGRAGPPRPADRHLAEYRPQPCRTKTVHNGWPMRCTARRPTGSAWSCWKPETPRRRRRTVPSNAAPTGIKLAMDDLGSGYSSLQRLSTLPFDTIKIDQSLT